MRQKFNKITLLVMVLGLALTESLNWKLCPGVDSKYLKIDRLQITPFPVVKGESLQFVFTGQPNLDVSIKSALVEYFEANNKRMTLPTGPSGSAKVGKPFTYVFSHTISPYIAYGTFEFRMSLLDTMGSVITCVTFTQTLYSN